jgi:LPXTG-motif cell wall-anchored protein
MRHAPAGSILPRIAGGPPAPFVPPAALPVADADEGFGGWWVWVLVGLVVLAGGVGLLLRRRRAE